MGILTREEVLSIIRKSVKEGIDMRSREEIQADLLNEIRVADNKAIVPLLGGNTMLISAGCSAVVVIPTFQEDGSRKNTFFDVHVGKDLSISLEFKKEEFESKEAVEQGWLDFSMRYG